MLVDLTSRGIALQIEEAQDPGTQPELIYRFINASSGSAGWTLAKLRGEEQSGFGGQLVIETNAGGATPGDTTRERLRIDKDGNVGIGTASPTQALEVNGVVKATDFIKGATALVSSQWTDVAGIGINYTAGNVGIGAASPTQALEVNGAVKATNFIKGSAPLISSQWANGPSGISYMSGNVGIGTTTPSAQLHLSSNTLTPSPLRLEVLTKHLPGWSYRKPMQITATVTLSDYQLEISLNTQELIAARKMRLDGADLCFTDQNGQTLLNHWIESGVNTQNTRIWVRVPQIIGGRPQTIYLYYGNSDVISRSSAVNTFVRVIDGVIGAWPLDELVENPANPPQKMVQDLSGKGNSGIINGPVLATGRFGNALSFNGVEDHVNMGAKLSLSLVRKEAFTVEAWVYAPTLNTNPWRVIVSKEGEYEIAQGSNGNLQFALANASPGWNWKDTGFALPLDTWSHIVWTYSASNRLIVVYVNGRPIFSSVGQGALTDADPTLNEFRIGGRQLAGQYSFHGLIDQVRVYDRALAQPDVAGLYSNYGYTTLNFPGRVLVRRYTEATPQLNLGAEQSVEQGANEFLSLQSFLSVDNRAGNGYIGLWTTRPQGLLDVKGLLI